jgi:hypothetical protein
MPFGASIALAVSLAFTGSTSTIQTPTTIATFDQSQTVEEYVRDYFADVPVMAEVASCESHFTQFDKNGKVVKNANSSAVGVFQIMSSIHATFADEKLGLDIYSLQGNAAYARYMYERQGLKPWEASKSCWSKSQAYKDMQSASGKVAIATK